jgi:beta-N-acetylhexosaminidase
MHKTDIKVTSQSIGTMLLMGFSGENPDDPSVQEFLNYTREGILGGVLLYDRNIKDSVQLQGLTSAFIDAAGNKSFFIATDQEGGKVQRLNQAKGFTDTPAAKDMSENYSLEEAEILYFKMAHMLKMHGINFNLAPVVDLEPNGYVSSAISAFGRAYSNSTDKVVDYAKTFINAHKKEGVLVALKHFPGHGYAKKDTHEGFVNTTNTFEAEELKPFLHLTKDGMNSAVMTAHLSNANLDLDYPSTLSYKTITWLLRDKMHSTVLLSQMIFRWEQYKTSMR